MFKHASLLALIVVIGIVLQAALVHTLLPAAAGPDVFVILSVYFAIKHHDWRGAIGAFLLGVVADFASGQFLGPNAAGCIIAFLVAGAVAERVYVERGIAMMMTVALAAIVKSLTFVCMLALFMRINVLTSDVVKTIALEALFSALVAPLAMWLLFERRGTRQRSTTLHSKQSLRWS